MSIISSLRRISYHTYSVVFLAFLLISLSSSINYYYSHLIAGIKSQISNRKKAKEEIAKKPGPLQKKNVQKWQNQKRYNFL